MQVGEPLVVGGAFRENRGIAHRRLARGGRDLGERCVGLGRAGDGPGEHGHGDLAGGKRPLVERDAGVARERAAHAFVARPEQRAKLAFPGSDNLGAVGGRAGAREEPRGRDPLIERARERLVDDPELETIAQPGLQPTPSSRHR